MKRRQLILLGAATFFSCKRKADTDSAVMQPMDTLLVADPSQDPTVRDPHRPDPRGEMIRQRTLSRLRAARFTVAESLPTAGHRAGVPGALRSQDDIARRLLALAYVVAWVVGSEERSPVERLRSFAERGALKRFVTGDEAAIVALKREVAKEQHLGTIGWRTENMWPLAWMLGFDQEPAFTGEPVGANVMKPLIEFLPRWEADPQAWIQQVKARPVAEIVALEDIFYCAHNAARSAQLGHASLVPAGFDPLVNAGAIHERRHSLTWALSPGIEWDDTDLST